MSDAYLDPAFLSRLDSIDWFTHCGEPLQVPVNMRVHQLASLRLAVKAYQKQIWKDATLEARNDLTLSLNKVAPAHYHLWNDITDVAKLYMEERLEPQWVGFQERHGMDRSFVHSVQWSVLGAMMEHCYRHLEPPRFFSNLLNIYEGGRFPCGWGGGEWPDGYLLVY